MSKPSVLALEDGRIFHGFAFGADAVAEGEVVFSTSMTGYQEMCTDPSYHGQILCLTYPIVGNYGVSPRYEQSSRPWISGLIVRQHSERPSHYDSAGTLDEYLREHGIPGLFGVDTRALSRHIRSHGSRRGIIVPGSDGSDAGELVARARLVRLPGERFGVGEVSAGRRYTIEPDGSKRARVVVIDCGLKSNILRSLAARPVETIVVPYSATAEEVLALEPDGVVTSPGPGDPESAETAIRTVRGVVERDIPFFGICLGNQILGLAVGATTSKLKFGHRGGNHPVKELETGRVYITSQNHSYQVNSESVPEDEGWHVSHVNVNDGSVEGLVHETKPAFSVQYHPEGSPGPEENGYLFDRFVRMVEQHVRRDA